MNSRIILITGCSSGFGLLIASRLASKGHKVIATMRNLEKQDALLTEVNKRGGELCVLPLDVTDKKSITDTVRQVVSDHGHVDVLINNAGFGMGGFFEDLTDEEIRAQMETNFFGVQNVMREIIPLMRLRRQGKIINVSSVAGLSSSPCFSAYNASKWALEGFTESLYYELKLFGIGVCLIEPGTYKTRIFYENARRAKNFDNEQSPYYSLSKCLYDKTMSYVEECRKDPEVIAILAEKLVNAKNSPLRNISDFEGKIMLLFKRFLPFRLYSAIIQRVLFEN